MLCLSAGTSDAGTSRHLDDQVPSNPAHGPSARPQSAEVFLLSDAQCEPILTHASQETASVSSSRDDETTEIVSNRPATSDVGHSGSHRSADLLNSQKTEGEVAPTCQARRNRLQKCKPNLLQTSKTARSKPQVTKESSGKVSREENSSQTVISAFRVKSLLEIKPEKKIANPQENPSQTTVPPMDLVPSLDLGSTITATGAKHKEIVQDDTVAIVQSASVNENLSEVHLQPSRKPTFVIRPTSESLECDSSDSASSKDQGSNTRTVPETCSDSAAVVTTTELLPDQREEVKVVSISQARIRLQKFKPKPNLQTARSLSFKPQTTEDPVKQMQFVEKSFTPVSGPESSKDPVGGVEAQSLKSSSTEEQKTDVGYVLDLGSQNSEPNEPRRSQRYSKVKPKPNLASFTRTRAKSQPRLIDKLSEQHKDSSSGVRTMQQSANKNRGQTELKLTDSGSSVDTTNNKDTCSDSVVIATSSFAGGSGKKSTGDKMSKNNTVEAEPASQRDCKLDISRRVTELKTQPSDDPAAFQSPKSGSTESEINPASPNVYSIVYPKESSHESCDSALSDHR